MPLKLVKASPWMALLNASQSWYYTFNFIQYRWHCPNPSLCAHNFVEGICLANQHSNYFCMAWDPTTQQTFVGLQDVLKTSSEDVWVRRIYSSWSRRLQDVLKTSSEDKDERRLQDVFIKTNVCWEIWLKSEAALQRCSYKNVFWKYTSNLQENIHAEVWFQ